jgi:hypothetical protein
LGAAKSGITAFFTDVLLQKVPQIVIFNRAGLPPNLFYGLKGAVNQKG